MSWSKGFGTAPSKKGMAELDKAVRDAQKQGSGSGCCLVVLLAVGTLATGAAGLTGVLL